MITARQRARYQRLLDDGRSALVKAEAYRAKLAESCDHPESYVKDYEWEHDNGYGRQRMVTGKMCKICRATKSWGDLSQWSTQ